MREETAPEHEKKTCTEAQIPYTGGRDHHIGQMNSLSHINSVQEPNRINLDAKTID